MAVTATAELALAALRIAEECGLDPAELANASGISLEAATRPDARVEPERALHLWMLVLERCSTRDFIGRLARALAMPRTGDIVGYMARNSATLRQAWTRVAKYARLIEGSLDMRFVQGPRTSAMRWTLTTPLGELPHAMTEAGTSALVLTAEDWTGTKIEPTEVRFTHSPTSTAETLFRCNIVFDAPANEVILPDAILDTPLRNPDPWLGEYFEARARTLLEAPLEQASFRWMVQERIRESLSGQAPTVATVSKRLGMSGRTLQRKLSHEGLQFSDLVEDVRRDIALAMLREPHHSVYEIASHLGYQDLQSFRSMFARWTGMTPRDFRAQARAGRVGTLSQLTKSKK